MTPCLRILLLHIAGQALECLVAMCELPFKGLKPLWTRLVMLVAHAEVHQVSLHPFPSRSDHHATASDSAHAASL